MKKRVLIALAVLGTVFITACGGNDSSASPSQDDGAAVVTPTVTQEATPAVTEEVKEEVTAHTHGGNHRSSCGRKWGIPGAEQYIRR